jgi:hypothetical protein
LEYRVDLDGVVEEVMHDVCVLRVEFDAFVDFVDE